METQPKKEINYWFVDAGYKSFEDRKRLSLADKKIWLCNNDHYGDLVRTMQPGDKVALKSHFFRKYDLPFNNKGKDVPVMSIEAIGVVVKNFNDGKKVSVVWNKYESPREWYFYTSQALVFRIQKDMWMSDNLLAFTFEQHSQDLQRFLLTPYWHDRFNDTQPYFFWSNIGESLAKRLIEFRNKREKFIPLLHLLFKQIDPSGSLLTHQQLVSAHDMDPFAILELCFRALISKKIRGNIGELVKFFAIDPSCLNVKQDIPFIDPEKQCYFAWTLEPDELRINILWQLLDAALHYTDKQDLQGRANFVEVFEQARKFYSLANITLALSWIKPWTFLSLTEEVIRRSPKDIAEFIQNNGMYYSEDVRYYLELIENLDHLFLCGKFSINSFPALTQYVYQPQLTKSTKSLKSETKKSTFETESDSDSFINLESIEKHDLSHSNDTDITLDFHLTTLPNTQILDGIKESTVFDHHINKLTEREAKLVLEQPTMLDETANIEPFQIETISPMKSDSDAYQSMAYEFNMDSDGGLLEEFKSITFDSVMHYPTMLDYEIDAEADVIQSEEIKPLPIDSEAHFPSMLDYEIDAEADVIQPKEIKPLPVNSERYHPTMLDYEMETSTGVTQSGEVKPLLDTSEVYHPTMLDEGMDADTTQTMRVTPLVSNSNRYNTSIVEHHVNIEDDSIQAEMPSSFFHDLDYIKSTLQADVPDDISEKVLSSPFELYDTKQTRQEVKETEADILLTGIISPLSNELVEAEPLLQAKETQVKVISSELLSPLSGVLDNSKPLSQTEETEADILLTGILSPLSYVLNDSKPQKQTEETEADILLTGILSPLSNELVEAKPLLQTKEINAEHLAPEVLSATPFETEVAKPTLQAEEVESEHFAPKVISATPFEPEVAEPTLQTEEIKVEHLAPEVLSATPFEAEVADPPLQAEEIKVEHFDPEVISAIPFEPEVAEPTLQAEETNSENLAPKVISATPFEPEVAEQTLQVEEIESEKLAPEILSATPFEAEVAEPTLQAEEIKVEHLAPEIISATPFEPEVAEPTLQTEEIKVEHLAPEVLSATPFEAEVVKPALQEEEVESENLAPEVLSATPFEPEVAEPTLQEEEVESKKLAPEVLSATPFEAEVAKPIIQAEEIKVEHFDPEVISAIPFEPEVAETILQAEEINSEHLAPEVLSATPFEPEVAEPTLQAEEIESEKLAPKILSATPFEPEVAEPTLQAEETNSENLAPKVISAIPFEAEVAKPIIQAEETNSENLAPKVISATPFEAEVAKSTLQEEEVESEKLAPEVISATPFETEVAKPIIQAEETKVEHLAPEVISATPFETEVVKPIIQAEETKVEHLAPEVILATPFEPEVAEPTLQAEETKVEHLAPEVILATPFEPEVAEPTIQAEEIKVEHLAPEVLSATPFEPEVVKPIIQAEETKVEHLAPEVISAAPFEPEVAEPTLQAEEVESEHLVPEVLSAKLFEPEVAKPTLQSVETNSENLAPKVISATPFEAEVAEPTLQAEEIKVEHLAPEVLSATPFEAEVAKPIIQAEETNSENLAPKVISATPFEAGGAKPTLQEEEVESEKLAPEVISAAPFEPEEVAKPTLQAEEIESEHLAPEVLSATPLDAEVAKLILQVEEIQDGSIPPDQLLPLQINLEDNECIQHSKEVETVIFKEDLRSSSPSNLNDYSPAVPINEIKSNESEDNETNLVEEQSRVNNSLEQDHNPITIKDNDQHLSKRRTKASVIINSVKQALAALSSYHTDEQSIKTNKIDNDFNQLLINEKLITSDSDTEHLLDNSQKITVKKNSNDATSSIQNNVSYDKAAVLDLLANYKEKDTADTSLSHSSTESSIIGSSLQAIGSEPSQSQTIVDEKTAIKEPQIETALEGSEIKSETSKAINNNLASSPDSLLDTILNDCFFDKLLLQDIMSCLKDKHNLVLQGSGGTGKSWLARRLAFILTKNENTQNIYTLQSHSNLSYERFIGQLYIDDRGNQKIKEGIFLSLIRSAQQQPEIAHVMIIEDIHRINPTEIFGDLFSLLDINQRTEENAIIFSPSENGKEHNRIIIPNNVYIIATMNIIPSCLYSMGYEWRRPFAFVSLEPQINERWRNWLITHCNVNPLLVMDIQQRILELNQMIAADSHLGRHCCIGHSYVTPNKPLESNDTRGWFKRIVEMEIAPLLDLYWSDRPEYALQAKKRLLEGW